MRLPKNHISLIKQACMWAGVCMHVQPVLQARPTFARRATSVCGGNMGGKAWLGIERVSRQRYWTDL